MSVSRRELYILFATLFLALVSFSIIFPLVPDLLLEMGATPFQAGLMVTVNALCQFLFAPIWGSLSDRVGRKPVLVMGMAGFAVSFVLMGIAPNYELLLLGRALGGILSAATFPTAQAYVADSTTPEDRGPAMATMGAASSTGFIMGPVIGGALAAFGLRVPFFVSAAAVAATGLAGFIWLKEPEHRAAAGKRQASPFEGLRNLALALGSPHRLLFILAFVVTFCGSMLFSMAGYYLNAKVGGSYVQTTLLFVVQGTSAAAIQGLLVGRLIRRIGDEWTIAAGTAAGIIGFTSLVLSRTLPQILGATVMTAAAMGLIRPTIASAVSKRTAMEQGVTMGIQSSFDSLGRVVGPMVAGVLFDWHYDAPYGLAAAVYVAAAIVAVSAFRRGLPRTGPEGPPEDSPAAGDASGPGEVRHGSPSRDAARP